MQRLPKAALVAMFSLVFSVLLPMIAAVQDRKPWQFPSELRGRLQSRIDLFLNAQAEGQWDDIGVLLGDYRRADIGYIPYTAAHKACLISQMKKDPMVEFNFTIPESPFSSEILTNPAGRTWWTLVGEGVFRVGTNRVKKQTLLIAYRDKGDWYFTPFNFDDDASARAQLTDQELSKDRKDEVQLLVPVDSPLEVIDLHVFISPKDLKERQIHFRLRNKTSQRITQYGFKIDDERENGSISFGTGAARDAIEPGGVSHAFDENHSAYRYWCEGEARIRIQLDQIVFEDGTNWNPPESPSPDKAQK